MKYKRFKKISSNFWIGYEQFNTMFDSIICAIDKSDCYQVYKRIEHKNTGIHACCIQVSQSTMMTLSITQPDIVTYPKNYEYTSIRTFLIKEKSESDSKSSQTEFDLIKTLYHQPRRDSHFEVRLEKGVYKLLIDVDPTDSEYGKTLNLNFYTDHKAKINLINHGEAGPLYKTVLSSLSIKRGIKSNLLDNESVRKYVLEIQKLGLIVHTFVNRSINYYKIAEKLAPFNFLCSKSLEDNDKLLISLPPNALKLVTFKYVTTAQQQTVNVLESSCLLK